MCRPEHRRLEHRRPEHRRPEHRRLQSTRTPHLIAQPARIRRHPTRPVNCAVPAPGVMNGAPTSYAAKQPPRNDVQPPQCNRRTVGATLVSPGTPARPNPHARPTSTRNPPQPPTHNATGQLCRSGTGRHEWRPYELRRKTTDAKQRSAAAIQQTHRRGDTCVARNTGAWNTAARNTAARNTAASNPHARPTSSRNPPASADTQRDRSIVPFRHRAS